MRVAVYIRVSTHMQVEDGYSLSAQRERLKAFAYSQGWEIVEYYVDEGISAKDMERPELQRMLKGVRNNLFDVVLVYKLDRLTRSVIDLDKLLKIFSNHNVMFKSSTEVYDTTTATGRLFIRLVASMAQWERENLGERIRMGLQEKARDGKWTTNTAPMGYDLDGKDALKINHSEALIVKEIYSLYIKGTGMSKIARELNQKGIYSKKGKHWSQYTVRYVLTNPIYVGTMRYNYRMNTDQYFEVENAVPAIIKKEEFDFVQEIIASRQNLHPQQVGSKHIFSKVLKCARCGATLTGKTSMTKRKSKKYYSYGYICPNKVRGLCDLPMINQNHLEAKFMSNFTKNNVDIEINKINRDKNDTSTEEKNKTIAELEKELKEIEKRRSKWQFAWVQEFIKDEEFKKRMNEEEEKEKMILGELEKIRPVEKKSNVDVSEILKDIQSNWDLLDVMEKKQLVSLAIKEIKIDRVSMERTTDAYVFRDFIFN